MFIFKAFYLRYMDSAALDACAREDVLWQTDLHIA